MIVSNSSPLISLARIGRLDLLHRLYKELHIPQAVWNEVVLKAGDQPGVAELKTTSWIKTETVSNRELVKALQRDLDAGESEAIALALEKKAELLLMDEPSTGLSPILVADVGETIRDINREGISILLVEQNCRMALKLAKRAYILETGSIALTGEASELINNDMVKMSYLGG